MRADLPWLAGWSLVGGCLGPLLLMPGLARTDAASASLLLNLEGLATLAIAWLVFRENVDRRLLLGALAILAGGCVLAWGGGVRGDPGALRSPAPASAWGIDNNLTRKLSAADPVQLADAQGPGRGQRQPRRGVRARRRHARAAGRSWRPVWWASWATA